MVLETHEATRTMSNLRTVVERRRVPEGSYGGYWLAAHRPTAREVRPWRAPMADTPSRFARRRDPYLRKAGAGVFRKARRPPINPSLRPQIVGWSCTMRRSN